MSMLVKLFKALNANQAPGQIALSFVLGMILGLTPLLFPHNLLTLFLIAFLRVNLSAVIVATVFFSGLAYLLDPVFHQIGLAILQASALQSLFTDLYNNAFWRWLHFNNSIVMGSVVTAYLLSLPAFGVFLWLVKTYRQRFLVWVNQFKIVQLLNGADKAGLVSKVMQ
ncbi:MAG: DUF2062 domain-containing protein [Hydrogenovibrio sp.]